MLEWNWGIFALGVAGAFAPEAVRLWEIRADPGPPALRTFLQAL